jgi:hypothetical protein
MPSYGVTMPPLIDFERSCRSSLVSMSEAPRMKFQRALYEVFNLAGMWNRDALPGWGLAEIGSHGQRPNALEHLVSLGRAIGHAAVSGVRTVPK